MPTYEYECKSCAHGFEVFQAMSDAPIKDCPKCGNDVRRLIFGGAGVIFKGSGFYVTDKSKGGKSEKTAKPDSPSDSAAPSACPHSQNGSCPASTGKDGSSGCPASKTA